MSSGERYGAFDMFFLPCHHEQQQFTSYHILAATEHYLVAALQPSVGNHDIACGPICSALPWKKHLSSFETNW